MIRKAIISDAENLASLIKQVERESDYMLYGPGERDLSLGKQQKMLHAFSKDTNSEIFVAEQDEKLAGYLIAIGGKANKTKHSAYLVIGILLGYRGKGIGTALFHEMEHWALNNGLHRLELTVVRKNLAGVSLYTKAGFEIEGVKKDSLLIDGNYMDEYYMAKILEGER